MGWFREAHRYGNWIFAVRTSGNEKGKWQLIATVAPRLRVSLEEFSFKKLEICPLVSCQHPDMGVLYSVLPEAMYNKLPSLDEIHCNTHKTIDLGELENAEAVIKAAKEGFNAALKTGGTDHWFIRQLIMACQPLNKKLTFCNPWMIENVKSRFIIDKLLEEKAMATLEKAGLDMVALAEILEAYVPLQLKPHDKRKILAKAQLKASSTDYYDGVLNMGRCFSCDEALWQGPDVRAAEEEGEAQDV